MGETAKIVNSVQSQIAASDPVLKEARARRELVKGESLKLDGALRTFNSGSVAHGFVNGPVSDADCGLVLDRRSFPDLGPDGAGPEEIIEKLAALVRDGVRDTYPDARVAKMKRGLKITFGEPLEEQDPYVDLIVTMTRKDDDGLWVPNRADDGWDASHPEKHTELFTSGEKEIRVRRARLVRLAKGWNKQWAEPAFSSFNLAALAWEFTVNADGSFEDALASFFAYAAEAIDAGNTTDPAGISDTIELRLSRDIAVKRLVGAADQLRRAVDHDTDAEVVRDALASVFRDYVDAPIESKSALASVLRDGNARVTATKTGLSLGAAGVPLKTTPAYGGSSHG